ncbi:hypothetical protein C8R47DRAFT_1082522 [Mycena vitilis]|nr:hypothetical protein C8R47DRAFT_1082522 [Mycena vitilis]
MTSTAASRVPDELVSEILSPLLKHSDEVFSDRVVQPLLEPGYSSSTYLLVCKDWLRVSTPLLYNVVILRTTPQAEALEFALQSSPEIGLFIEKLRVEGGTGFGNVMRTILKSSPNITDLFLTLGIHASDSVRGLKNRLVDELLEALDRAVSKWDNLKIMDFPYGCNPDLTVTERAKALASALVKSKTIKTIMATGFGFVFPESLHQMGSIPSLKSIHFTHVSSMDTATLDNKLRQLVTFRQDSDLTELAKARIATMLSTIPAPPPLDLVFAGDLKKLKQLGETIGPTVKNLDVLLLKRKNKPCPPLDLTLLIPFTSVTRLIWRALDPRLVATTPPPDFSPFPQLAVLEILGESPTMPNLGLQLPFPFLREVYLREVDVAASVAFLQCHGAKLTKLTAPLDVLVNSDVSLGSRAKARRAAANTDAKPESAEDAIMELQRIRLSPTINGPTFRMFTGKGSIEGGCYKFLLVVQYIQRMQETV